jgi:hypothetical protein
MVIARRRGGEAAQIAARAAIRRSVPSQHLLDQLEDIDARPDVRRHEARARTHVRLAAAQRRQTLDLGE